MKVSLSIVKQYRVNDERKSGRMFVFNQSVRERFQRGHFIMAQSILQEKAVRLYLAEDKQT